MAENKEIRQPIQRYSPQHMAAVSVATVVSVLLVIFVVNDVARQPVLVTSLASSAFLLYFQPRNEINNFKPLVLGHLLAAAIGFFFNLLLPEPYLSTALSLGMTVVALTALRLVHPPAISTSLVFAYRAEDVESILIFLLTLVVIVALALIYFFLNKGIHVTRWAPFLHAEEE